MALSESLLSLLVCPETLSPLRPAGAELLRRVNESIEAQKARNRAGKLVEDRLEEALVCEDGPVLYPVRDGIPVLLVDEAIPVDV